MDSKICCLVVQKNDVKNIKTQLEERGLLNKKYRITSLSNMDYALPLSFKTCSLNDGDRISITQDEHETNHNLLKIDHPYSIKFIEETRLCAIKFKTPFNELKIFVQRYMEDVDLAHDHKKKLLVDLPKKWEIHDDLILFPDNSFTSDFWDSEPNVLWVNIAKIFSVKRIATVSRICNDDYRTPHVVLRLGHDSWVQHIDNGIVYTFDVRKNMFSKGNITEKLRISEFKCTNEIVVDMFAGIGYFTLPYLLKANAEKVIACEWNPHAVLALERNLKLNNVENRCEVRQGDNREVAPKNIADRVNLGLIPTSAMSWDAACKALKSSTGGWLHIHENIESKPIETNQLLILNQSSESDNLPQENDLTINIESNLQYKNNTLTCTCETKCIVTNTYKGILNDRKRTAWCHFSKDCVSNLKSMLNPSRKWNVFLRHIEYVKSYAPHVDHLVFDFECRPVQSYTQ